MTHQVLELLTYRLQPGLTPDAFLALVAATLPALERHPGLLARTLAHHDGTWTETIRWTSQAHADAAGQAIRADPAVAPLMQALDLASLTMRFVPVLWHKDS